MSPSPSTWVVVGAAAAAGIRRLSLRSGVSGAEASGSLAGDDVITHPMVEWTRGTTIRRPPDEVWPWLVQMGYHRGGWYTSEWLDRVIWRVDARNAQRILPEFQSLAVGDVVPDGPNHAAYFWVMAIEHQRAIVYHSIRHPYRGHPIDPTDHGALHRLEQSLVDSGTYLDFSWAFVLRPTGTQASRLLIRTRANYAPTGIRLAGVPLGLVDAFFAHAILRGVKRRAESNRQPEAATLS